MNKRKILFRGKRIDNGEWVEGGFVPSLDGKRFYIGNMFECVEIVHKTRTEYTGCTDKNGTRIFEGDIVTCDYFCGVVNFHEGAWCVTEEDKCPEYLYDLIDLKIIGNIHDNPELLKGE